MIIHKCKSHGKRICWGCLWVTISFPFEHGIFKYAPGFSYIGKFFGM